MLSNFFFFCSDCAFVVYGRLFSRSWSKDAEQTSGPSKIYYKHIYYKIEDKSQIINALINPQFTITVLLFFRKKESQAATMGRETKKVFKWS